MSNKHSYSWSLDHLYTKDTLKGKGLFASEEIPKDSIVVIFGGYVMSLEEERHLGEGMTDFAHMIHENFVFGVRDKDRITKTDFVNHSCNPNCGFSGQIFLTAMRNIEPHEEITFDYATIVMGTAGNRLSYNIECECGDAKCRGFITQNDWQKKELRVKYKGYFQPYIQKALDELTD